jgi:hypothetical protein
MPAAIFNSTKVKILKDRLSSFSDKDLIISGTANPTTSATDATPGTLYLNSSTGQVFRKQDSGSTTNWTDISDSIGDDYIISKENFENNIGNASTASTGCTVALNSTTELAGSQSLRCSTDTTDRTGAIFVLDAWTIKKGLFATVVNFETLVSTGANYLDEDWSIVLYDVTNGVKIPFLPEGLLAGDGPYRGSAQTSADGLSYEVRAYVDSDDTNARDVDFDNIKTYLSTPQTWIDTRGRQYSEAAGDFTVAYVSGGGTWTTTRAVAYPYKTKDGVWRMTFNIVGAASSATRTVFVVSIFGVTFKNTAGFFQDVSGQTSGSIANNSYANPGAATIRMDHASATTTAYIWSGDVELDSKPTWAIDDYPQTLGEDAGQRAVVARASRTSAQAVTTDTVIAWDTVKKDNTGSLAAGVFTVPESGDYYAAVALRIVAATGTAAAGENATINVYKNSEIMFSKFAYCTGTGRSIFSSVSGLVENATKGDTISIKVTANIGTTSQVDGSDDFNLLSIHKIQSPQQIAAGEKVFADYLNSAAQNATNGTNLTWNIKDYDSHNAFSSGIFTCPRSGILSVDASIRIASLTPSAGDSASLLVHDVVNNTTKRQGQAVVCEVAIAQVIHLIVNCTFYVSKGEQFSIRPSMSAGLSGSAMTTTSILNYVSFKLD